MRSDISARRLGLKLRTQNRAAGNGKNLHSAPTHRSPYGKEMSLLFPSKKLERPNGTFQNLLFFVPEDFDVPIFLHFGIYT